VTSELHVTDTRLVLMHVCPFDFGSFVTRKIDTHKRNQSLNIMGGISNRLIHSRSLMYSRMFTTSRL
jgi:hypothetical protein